MGGNVWELVQMNGMIVIIMERPMMGVANCTGNCPLNASDSNYDDSDSVERVVRGGA